MLQFSVACLSEWASFRPDCRGVPVDEPHSRCDGDWSHPWLALVSATGPDLDLGSVIRCDCQPLWSPQSPHGHAGAGRTARPTTRGATPGLPQARPGDWAATMKWSHESGNSIGCVITTTDRSAGGYLGEPSFVIAARKARRETPWKRTAVRHAQRST